MAMQWWGWKVKWLLRVMGGCKLPKYLGTCVRYTISKVNMSKCTGVENTQK